MLQLDSIKKSTLLQEALRRLGNTSYTVTWIVITGIMSRCNNMLQISGYNQKDKYHMTKGATKIHEEFGER